MNIREFEISTHVLKLREPFDGLSTRGIALLTLKADDGLEGIGEAAPLPLSADVSTIIPTLIAAGQSVFGADISGRPGREARLLASRFHPAVSCALELGILELRARLSGSAIFSDLSFGFCGEFSGDFSGAVPISCLLHGTKEAVIAQAHAARHAGFSVFKLKAGRAASVRSDMDTLISLREVLPWPTKLSVDANRSWDFDDACQYAALAKACGVAYIEEPLRDPSRLAELHNRTGASIALDESLPDMDPLTFRPVKGVTTLVLKPSALGGYKRCYKFLLRARELGLEVVVSSSFESGIGTRALGLFALGAAKLVPVVAGIYPYFCFAGDALGTSLSHQQGMITLDTLAARGLKP